MCVGVRTKFESIYQPAGMEFSEYVVKAESDAKAKMPVGNHGCVVDTNSRSHGNITTGVSSSEGQDEPRPHHVPQALDHSFHLGSL
jgi:hypothetical protein